MKLCTPRHWDRWRSGPTAWWSKTVTHDSSFSYLRRHFRRRSSSCGVKSGATRRSICSRWLRCLICESYGSHAAGHGFRGAAIRTMAACTGHVRLTPRPAADAPGDAPVSSMSPNTRDRCPGDPARGKVMSCPRGPSPREPPLPRGPAARIDGCAVEMEVLRGARSPATGLRE